MPRHLAHKLTLTLGSSSRTVTIPENINLSHYHHELVSQAVLLALLELCRAELPMPNPKEHEATIPITNQSSHLSPEEHA